jgi:hypothetical protein
MGMSDLPLPLDDPGYAMIPQYDQEPEPVVNILRQAISRLGTFPLLAAVVRVRAGISLELPAAFPAVEYQGTELRAD